MAYYSSEETSQKWKHDVFLSYRGADTRKTFVSHLYTLLKYRGITAFKDDEKLDRGKSIAPELLKAIDESRIPIIIFSENYASSGWCLDELSRIMECVHIKGQIPIPVFYHVDPSDVRNQRNSFGESLDKYQANLAGTANLEKVHRWRAALRQAASISGYDVRKTANGNESECIELIVNEIFHSLDRPVSAAKLVIMQEELAQLKEMVLETKVIVDKIKELSEETSTSVDKVVLRLDSLVQQLSGTEEN